MLRKVLYYVSVSKYFNMFINISIIFNTVVLAMDRHPIEPQEQSIFEIINVVFYIIFALEMIVKLIGLGPREYMRDKFNIFD